MLLLRDRRPEAAARCSHNRYVQFDHGENATETHGR